MRYFAEKLESKLEHVKRVRELEQEDIDIVSSNLVR
jgi:hypothetical protein